LAVVVTATPAARLKVAVSVLVVPVADPGTLLLAHKLVLAAFHVPAEVLIQLLLAALASAVQPAHMAAPMTAFNLICRVTFRLLPRCCEIDLLSLIFPLLRLLRCIFGHSTIGTSGTSTPKFTTALGHSIPCLRCVLSAELLHWRFLHLTESWIDCFKS
jgi:hypothetical protein